MVSSAAMMAAMMAMNIALIAAGASRSKGEVSTEAISCPPIIAGCVTLICVCLTVAIVVVLWDTIRTSHSLGELILFSCLTIATVALLATLIVSVWGTV